MLTSYLTQTQRLLQNPGAPVSLYDPADLTIYINEARTQVAGESKSIRVMSSLAITSDNQGPYAFTAINLGSAVGVQGVLDVETIWFLIGTGQIWIRPRPFPWFALYEMNDAAPVGAVPRVWSQHGQGVNGTIYLNLPDQDYTLNLDTVCYPIPLVDNTTAEAVPPLWQTAVPYYAAYLALLSAQLGSRGQEADAMFKRYTEFTARARQFATSEVMPFNGSQTGNPVQANQIGAQQGAPGQ